MASGQRGDFRAGRLRCGSHRPGGAGNFTGPGGWTVQRRDQADAAAVAHDVSLHAAGMSGGSIDRHGQRPRAFLRPRAGSGIAECRNDRQRVAAGAPHGPLFAKPNSRPGDWRGAGRPGPGFLSIAQPAPRRLRLCLGFTLARPDRPGCSSQNVARLHRRGGLPDQCARHFVRFVLV